MAEEIVTRFTADLSDLEAKVKEAAGVIAKFEDGADDAAGALGKTSNALGGLETKTRALVAADQALAKAAKEAAEQSEAIGDAAGGVDKLTDAEKEAARAAKDLANRQREAARETKTVADQAPRLNVFQRVAQSIMGAFRSAQGAVRAFAQGAKEGFQEAIGEVDKTRGSIGLLRRGVAAVGTAFRNPIATVKQFALGARDGFRQAVGEARKGASAAKDLSSGLDAAGVNTGRLGQAFRLLLSPLGLVVAGIAGFLLNLTRLDSVSDSLDKLKAGFTSFLDSLAGNATLEDTIAGIREAVELAERLDALNDRAIFNSVIVTRNRATAALLERQARNRTLSEEERIALLERSNGLLEQAAQTDLSENVDRANIAYRQLVRSIVQQNNTLDQEYIGILRGFDTLNEQAAQKILELQIKGFNVDPELLKAAADLRNQIVRDETEVGLLQERNQNKIDSLREQSAREQQEREQKAAEAREKALERERARLAELAKLRAQASGIRTDIEREQLRTATLGEDGAPTLSTQLLDIDFAQEDALAQAGAIFAQAEAAAKGHADELAKIEEEKAATLLAIRAKYDAQAKAAYDKFYADEEQAAKASRAAVTDALLSDTDRQANAIDAKYDALIDSLSKFVQDEDELNALRVALNKKRSEEIDAVMSGSLSRRQELELELVNVAADFLQNSIATFADSNVQYKERVEEINRSYADQLNNLQNFVGAEADLQAERARINNERNEALNQAERDAGRQRTRILLDTLQKVLTILIGEVVIKQTAQGGATGGVAGAIAGQAQAAIITAILTGLFSALISSVAGAYKGEEYITGRPDIPGASHDAYLRRVHKGERIMTAKANAEHWEPLQAMHTGKFEQWRRDNMTVVWDPILALGTPMGYKALEHTTVMPMINQYLEGDTGQRMAASVQLAKYYDANIVKGLQSQRKEQRRTNDLLEVIAQQRNDRRSGRAW